MLTNFHGHEAVRRKLKNNIYRIARMGQNFDDYPGFQQIPGMPILLQQSVHYDRNKSGYKKTKKKESMYIHHIIKRKYHDDFELGMLTMDSAKYFFATRHEYYPVFFTVMCNLFN